MKKLKNKKAPGANGIKAEDLKNMKACQIAEKLNTMLENRDEGLLHGLIVPVLKPSKEAHKPTSYRPITLLSVLRKHYQE